MKWLFSLHVFSRNCGREERLAARCQAGREVLVEMYGGRAFGADDVVTISEGLPRLP
jgi:hypothetical protein